MFIVYKAAHIKSPPVDCIEQQRVTSQALCNHLHGAKEHGPPTRGPPRTESRTDEQRFQIFKILKS